MTNIAKQIRYLRKSKKLTQKDLARDTGLSYKTIVNYENGVRSPNFKAMVILENFFNVSGAYLRGETDELNKIDFISCMNDEDLKELYGLVCAKKYEFDEKVHYYTELMKKINSLIGGNQDEN